MEPNESYSIKGDQMMKEANKKLKGRVRYSQVLSLATSWATNPNVPRKPSNSLNRLPPTTNLPNDGTTQPEPILNVSNATRPAKVDKLLISTRRLPMLKKRSTLQVPPYRFRMHKIFGKFNPAVHCIKPDEQCGKDSEKNSINIRKR